MKKLKVVSDFSRSAPQDLKKKKRERRVRPAPEKSMPLFSETVRIRVVGFNQPRLLTALSRESVAVRNIEKLSPREMRLDLSKKECRKTFAILEKMCYTYSVERSSGVGVLARKALSRVGLLAGLVLFIGVLAFTRGYIWRVELSGFDKVPEQSLVSVLRDAGVRRGGRLNAVEPDRVRNALNSVDGILETTVEVVGTTVRVAVTESTDYVRPDPGAAHDIVADYDAEITRIVLRQGTALVQTGQRVFRGTPLIGAYRLDEEGNVDGPVQARGVVYGNVAFTQSLTFSSTEYILRPTGKTYRSTVLRLFGLNIGKRKNPFEHYESRLETVDAFRGTLLPVKVVRETITETEYAAVEYDPEARAEELTRRAVLDTVIRCGGNEITATHTLRRLSDNLYALNVFIRAEMPVGKA